ncbi:MAG: Tyrosine recombinase XerC [Candidatus Ordinivivax streblomastigis]|uniref:Tyrosine recombinase XerC n=1 Tax=Candidatus Ordinivivax streblomastigis TaxID=2540710 RepID=A0A5M8P476_9BACT|nr:MAG: Tyrosine recombinase XerC [Candidatus Ordinivivax streblomastigis]
MKRTIKFDLFPKKVGGILVECRPIRMRVSYSGIRVDIRVGYSIEFSKWNEDEGRVIAGSKNKYKQSAGEINKAILSCEEQIEDIFTRYEHLEKRPPTPTELKQVFDENTGRKEPEPETSTKIAKTFYEVYAEFMETMGQRNNWTKATYTKFSSLREHLQNYNSVLSFELLNEETLQGFITSLNNADLRNTTISKYMSFLRWFLRWAHNKGYNPSNVHETFKPKFKGADGNLKEVIYLEWEELLNLYSFKFPASLPSLPAVRDVFCFCCFTGLRYSDVAKLRHSDIKENYISVVTQKTVDGLIIELNKYSRAILNKYAGIRFPNDKALPVISNVKMNEHLKTMGELAGIDEPQRVIFFKGNIRHEEVLPKYALLTTHCGRRTFIVNALRLGVPSEVIMKWTGHSDYKAMKPYIKIVDKLKVAEMDKFNKFTTPKSKKGKTTKK